jgi:hypothetical protein
VQQFHEAVEKNAEQLREEYTEQAAMRILRERYSEFSDRAFQELLEEQAEGKTSGAVTTSETTVRR